MGDFKAQVDEVRVLPLHVQLQQDADITQLQCLFCESSGSVSYDTARAGVAGDSEGLAGEALDNSSVVAVNRSLEEGRYRVEKLEKLIITHRGLMDQLPEGITSATNQWDRFSMLVRHKLALASQKVLPGSKTESETTEKSTLLDRSCADFIRFSVDCTIEEFEMIGGVAMQKCNMAHFHVDGHPFLPKCGSLSASFDVAEILFDSLSALRKSIGISSETDLLAIAMLEAKTHGKSTTPEDAALLVFGSFLAYSSSENKPAAILVCRSLHEGMDPQQKFSVLWRESRELVQRTVWYSQGLEQRKTSVSSLLRDLYDQGEDAERKLQVHEKLRKLSREVNCFSVRFKPTPSPKPRMWSRSMIPRSHFAGSCEVEVPYILLRGSKAVKEISTFVDQDYIIQQAGAE